VLFDPTSIPVAPTLLQLMAEFLTIERPSDICQNRLTSDHAEEDYADSMVEPLGIEKKLHGMTAFGLSKPNHTRMPWKRTQARSKKLLVSSVFLSSLLLPAAKSATAQAPAPQEPSRELLLFMEVPMVVTPARREQPLTKAPSTTTVITAEEIRRSGATNIPDLFRSVPGLDFFRVSASDVNITARGLNRRLGHRMQVFVDGRSIFEDFLNLTSWHELPISLHEIERIEIVKSPASALFGANAFIGVIHIITKSPKALEGTHIAQSVGSSGANITNFVHAGVADKLGYKLSFEHDRANHFPNPLIGRSRDEKGRQDFRGNILAEYEFTERSRVSLAAGIDGFDRDIDPGLVPGPTPSRVFADGGLGFAKLNYSLGDFKSQFVWDRLDMDLRSPILPKVASVRADTFKLDVQHSLHLGKQNVLTGGASYRFNIFDSPFLTGAGRKQNHFAVFVQDEYSPLHNLTFTAGMRVDTHPEAGVTVAPRGSVVFTPWEDHTFRFSVSRAFRNPSILENFVHFDVLTGLPPPADRITILGNRHLKPEEITSYELGYQSLLFKRLKARIDLFYNRLDNMSTGTSPTGPIERTVLTGGGGSIFGGELGFEFLISEWLKGFANYSYQERNLSRNVLGVGSRHKGNVGLNLTLPQGFEADVFVNTVGKSTCCPGKTEPYTVATLRLGYQFRLLGTKGNLGFSVFNLFNDRHREILGGDIIERRIIGGVQFSL
jgi:iron complex outermembrane recepter protein